MSAQDVVYAAQSQVGYNEKLTAANLELFTSPNDGNGNYTKYGAWAVKNGFGANPAEWCDMFVSWCGSQAGEAAAVGKFAYVPAHIQWFQDQGRFFLRGDVTPIPGDVIFFEYMVDGVKDGDHVELVEYCDGTSVHTVGGNSKNAYGIGSVNRKVYSISDPNIYGYGRPAYSGGSVDPEPTKDLEVYDHWKIYKNGSTPEPVYADTDFSLQTGSLNPYEECYCTGRYGDAYHVLYKVDGTADTWKVGYVRYDGGVTDG